ncbi:LysR family transcriptional regulator [Frisingicoccus caecimuris]|uniref:LysR family transcriptional regulator n=1 Tax=Frisingicoccus caecimuris TaxID=1796636 RepID=A0A4R2LCT2_9FIRM|nr:LysR family transcriptional regulator [Frisingicoccus caecimuris]MCR1918343.1 LysR family transcriptional regulator [Frisingicoccus caecimuris]TCO84991.1 LysR family transcriptional regulator [Frisingicoccus caecimuris]
MNWQHLIYFKKVAECEHLTRASEELFISTSALSKAIANLEEELGIVLFEKSGRNIQLNRYGKMFYNYVVKATGEIEEGIHFIQRAANVYTRNIHVSTIFSVGTNYLPELLSRFNKEYPQIHIELSQKTTRQILSELSANQLDLGFCSEFNQAEEYPFINRDLLYAEEIFLAIPAEHPLADRTEVCFEDIHDETFISYNHATGIASTISKAIEKTAGPDFHLKTVFSVNDPYTITHMVAKGLGLGFVIENSSLYTANIKLLKVTDLNFFHPIYMVWKDNVYMSPAANALRKYALCHRNLRTPYIRPAF